VPMIRPAPNIDIKFIFLVVVLNVVGRNPRIYEIVKIPKH